MKKRFKIKMKYRIERPLLVGAIIISLVPILIFALFFRDTNISIRPNDWISFLSILYAAFLLIATIVLGYFVHTLNKRNTIKPLQYQAYLEFMNETEQEINTFKSISEKSELSEVHNSLVNFQYKYLKFIALQGFLFVDIQNSSNGYASYLSNQIKSCIEHLSRNPNCLVPSDLRMNIFQLCSNIVGSLQFALGGYDIIDKGASK